MSFGSNEGGSVGGIGGHEGGIGGGGGLGGPGAPNAGGDWGGAGGFGGGTSVADAMAQSDAQAKQNNAERALADIGYGSSDIGQIMNDINNLSLSGQSAALDAVANIAIKEDYKERGLIDKIQTLYTQHKVGGDLGLYGTAIGEGLAESVLGLSSGKIAAIFAGPFGKKIGDQLSSYAANKARDNFITNLSKYGLEKAKEIAREETALHKQEYGTSGNPKEIFDTVNKALVFEGVNPMGFWEDITGESSSNASIGAANTAAGYQQRALNYLQERDIVPRVFSEGATKRLGGFYGLEGGEEGVMSAYKDSPIYANLMAGREQGEESILRNASATGGLRSGNVQENLYDYNVNSERQALNQYLGGLGGFTGLSGYAPQVANTMSGIGQTLAGGQLGAAQAQQAGTANLIGLAGSVYQGLGGYQGISDLAGGAWDLGSSAVSGIGSAIGSLF